MKKVPRTHRKPVPFFIFGYTVWFIGFYAARARYTLKGMKVMCYLPVNDLPNSEFYARITAR